ncbi:hypothetical protein [Streptomyces sp. NPDC001292]|uniref:hypothetical protein n=1 Tax=Streptomyces sp. NPDC001292 TaxID=3364558 RepID=UPI0036A903D0
MAVVMPLAWLPADGDVYARLLPVLVAHEAVLSSTTEGDTVRLPSSPIQSIAACLHGREPLRQSCRPAGVRGGTGLMR